ncbi:MAG: ketopantoate reductase family protein [Streptosporangiaceae bacterium]
MARFAIIGAGAVGGWFGARLLSAGHDVVLVARGAHLAKIRSSGLVLRSDRECFTVNPSHATDDIESIVDVDFAFVTVKLWETEAVARKLVMLARRGTIVVSLQNGIDKDDMLSCHIPRDSILGGVSYISARILEPGLVFRDAPMEKITVGEYGQLSSDRSTRLVALLANAGVQSAVSPDIERTQWEKFVFLVGVSGLTALTRLPIGGILADKQARSLLWDVMDEVVRVGRARSVGLSSTFAADRVSFCDSLPASMTSSMYQDLVHGRRLELPWLSARVSELGASLSVDTRANEFIAKALGPFVLGTTSLT